MGDNAVARPYDPPTLAYVKSALEEGARDPALTADLGWSEKQQQDWAREFNAHVKFLAANYREGEKAREKARYGTLVRASEIAQQPPYLRDVYAGGKMGAAEIGSALVRPLSGSDADLINRSINDESAAYSAAQGGGGVQDVLQSGVRGTARSLTLMTGIAATGAGGPGIIAGFAASRANQAITEANDAGLDADAKFNYVGRAALIEGGVAGAFQALGLGGAEKMFASGALTRATAKELLKETAYELTEENITELLDAWNQELSGVSGPLTKEQAAQIVLDTTVQTLMTMGTIHGVKGVGGRAQRDAVLDGWAQAYGWTRDQGMGVIKDAEKRKGGFERNIGRAIEDEASLSPAGLAGWALADEDAARRIAGIDSPSRREWKEVGLPDRPKDVRARVAADIREIVGFMDYLGTTQPDSESQAEQADHGADYVEGVGQEEINAAVAASLDEANALVDKPNPSPGDFEAAGLPRPSEETTTAAVGKVLDAIDAAEEGPPEPAPPVADEETKGPIVKVNQPPPPGSSQSPAKGVTEEELRARVAARLGADATPPSGFERTPAEHVTPTTTTEEQPGASPAPGETTLDEDLRALAKGAAGIWSSATTLAVVESQAEEKATTPSGAAALATPAGKTKSTVALARQIGEQIGAGAKFGWRKLKVWADAAYGGTLGEHAYEFTDAYEALELAINQVAARDAKVDLKQAKKVVSELGEILDRVPTQTTRSEEKDSLQQFSTPPHYAYAANWVANQAEGDVVLEPSGGTGSLAAHAKASGSLVIGNELSARRAALLAQIADEVHQENAEQLANILGPKLPPEKRPTLVIMNPPFSRNPNMKAKKRIMTGAKHIDQALELLRPGGRLVAIVGGGVSGRGKQAGQEGSGGMGPHSRAFAAWWDKIGGDYNVRVNVGVSGKVYAKYGTSFPTRLLVIDKTLPDTGGPVVTGSVETVEELVTKLEEVRNDRPAVGSADQQEVGNVTQKPGSEEGGGVAPGRTPAVDPGQRSGGPKGEDGLPSGPKGVRGQRTPGNERRGSGGVPAGERAPRTGPRAKPGEAEGIAAPDPAREDAGKSGGLQSAVRAGVEAVSVKAAARVAGEDEGTYETYQPGVIVKGAAKHPTPLVESGAMASVTPPTVSYLPKLQKQLVEGGVLSDAQLEAVVYAGSSHQQELPVSLAESNEYEALTGKNSPKSKRRGFFIGDGTGVGKGREAAGIILDNWNQGRRRAVWISENTKLFRDAERDWTALGGDKGALIGLHKVKSGDSIKKGEGIVFGTYDTLGTSVTKKEGKLTRVEQLAEWFGSDFDGVLIFDEAHNAGNAVESKGSRGKKKPSNRALMMVELQRRLPNARVVYLSATGATQVSNLAFAERLGLWGEGTEFSSREAFVDSVSAGGVAAMELVARDMKAQGMYLSRTLSFKGVGYSRLTHALTTAQRGTYDTLAEAWQTVLKNIDNALELTSGSDTGVDPTQKRQARAAFWGAHQRFFNQVLTAIQMPSVLSSLEEDLKAGKAPVIQVVNTLEASTERALAKLSEENGDLDELDLTPRDSLMQMIATSFPVAQMEQYSDANGNTRSRPVEDSEGNPVLNQGAVAMREALIDKLADISVPESPIDQIINRFGADNVSEITGRKRRVVVGKDGRREIQKRSKSTAATEIREFMDGDRKILIFSQAGATGASYHADNTAKNKKPRRHYVLQAGWRADQAIQGLGRSHRSNQAQPPEFRLVETDLPGHRRFISTIARRLEQLGALSRGQRTAGGGGLFSESDNLEGTHAQDALEHLLKDVVEGDVQGVSVDDFETQTGLSIRNDQGSAAVKSVKVQQFLNRLLSLKIDLQNKVFDAYAERLEGAIEYARQNGTLDVGMETLKAEKIEKASEKVIRVDKLSGAETKYVELRVFDIAEKVPFEDHAQADKAEFMRNAKSGRGYILKPSGTRTDLEGNIVEIYARWGPSGKTLIPRHDVLTRYTLATREEVQREWGEILSNMPRLKERSVHLITGTLLPVWNKLKGRPRVRRVTTESGERLLGREIREKNLRSVLEGMGVDHKTEAPSAERAQSIVSQGGLIEFDNGWSLRSSRVRDEATFEISGIDSPAAGEIAKGIGARKDRIGYKNRYFVPRGEGFSAVYERLTKSYGVSRVIQGADDARMYSPDAKAAGPKSRGRRGGGAPIQKVEVIDTIKRLWPGLAIRGQATFRRQFRVQRALGWYDPGLGEMRLRDAYDVTTALHELGHHFDRELGKFSGKIGLPAGLPAELIKLGRDLYGSKRPAGGYKSEGFAEFIREYLTGAEDLQSRAPKLYAWFTTEYLQVNPKEAAKLRELREKVELILTQTPQQAIEAFMRPTQRGWGDGKIAAALAGFESNWRDSALPLLRAMQSTGADLTKVSPANHPYTLATYYARSAGGRTKHAALSGTVDLWGIENGKSLREVLGPIFSQGDTALKEWKEYMVAKRALVRYHSHGINPGLSRAEAEAIVSERESRPGYAQAERDFTDFAHRALRPLVESGRMTEKEFEDVVDWNPVYVPFLRRVEIEGGQASRSGKGRAINRVTKRGSNLPIHDPIDAMLLQYERIQQVAMQQDVIRSLVTFYDQQKGKAKFLGQFLSEVPAPQEVVKFSGEQIRRQILDHVEKVGSDIGEELASTVDDILEGLWESKLTVFRQGVEHKGREKIVSTVVDGKRRFFEVQADLIPILEGVTQSQFLPGKIGAFVRGVTALQRLGATGLNPQFGLIRNLLRDTLTAAITSDYHFHIPVISTIRGSFLDLTNSDYARRYHAAGLDIAGRIGQDLNAAKRLSASMKGGFMARVSDPWLLIDGLRDVLSHSEVGPRLMEFEAAHKFGMEKWGSDRDAQVLAGAASKDVTVNFSRGGVIARKLNEIVLFFNAGVQSADKVLRAAGALEAAPWAKIHDRRQNAARTFARGASYLTSVALLLYLMNRDKEWWRDLPPYEKWGFLHVDTGESRIRIPLPFEAGAVFGALPIATIEEARSPGALPEALEVAFKGSSPIDVDGMHGVMRNVALLAPIADVLANEDWKGAPIVSKGVERNLARDQYGSRTTGLARLIGEHVPGGGMSPSQIDHLLNGYTGGLYNRTARAIETAVDPSSIRPGKDPSSIPVLGTLFLRPGTSRVVSDFYDRLKHLRQLEGSKVASFEELGELAKAERVSRELSATWRARRATISSGASAGEIRDEADALLKTAQSLIKAHNAREGSDRSAGLGSALYKLTSPSATHEGWGALKGVDRREAIAALRAEARRRGSALRARGPGGRLTAFGDRQARLVRGIRQAR